MFDRSYLKATNQLWKLVVFVAAPVVAIVLVGAALATMQSREQLAVILLISGILLGIVGLGWASISITCPKCKTRLFWLALKSQSQSNWLNWLLSRERCPRCDFRPS